MEMGNCFQGLQTLVRQGPSIPHGQEGPGSGSTQRADASVMKWSMDQYGEGKFIGCQPPAEKVFLFVCLFLTKCRSREGCSLFWGDIWVLYVVIGLPQEVIG